MHSVLVDPTVLTPPSAPCVPDEVRRYVDTLREWSTWLREPWVELHISKRAGVVLAMDGLYPDRKLLSDLLASNGVTTYDSNTIMALVDRLIHNTPKLEQTYKFGEVLVEALETSPLLPELVPNSETLLDMKRCMLLMALMRSCCSQPLSGYSTLLRGGVTIGNEIEICGTIHEVEHSRDDLIPYPIAPNIFRGKLHIIGGFRELVIGIDPTELWLRAANDGEKHLAVCISTFQTLLEQGGTPELGDCAAFRFGPEFLQRVDELCTGPGRMLIPKLLFSMVETILSQNLRAIHSLRIKKGGDSAQRTRNGDKAWRRDIDDEYHLHYWECTNHTIEFGWVGPEKDFRLPI